MEIKNIKMVLIITSSIDGTVQYLLDSYQELKKASFRLDVDRLDDYIIDIECNGWRICHKQREITSRTTQAIYYRKPVLPNVSEYERRYQSMIQKDIIALVNGIADSFKGLVISRPCMLRKAENKIYQLLIAKRYGFEIPKSYIGNSNAVCKSKADGSHIIKPISMGKIRDSYRIEIFHTSRFDKKLCDISLTPVYLQNYVKKKYEVRVTVIGECFYTVRIDTKDKYDWRKDYENHRYSLIECPKKIKENCEKMLHDHNLFFGAFDFIVTPEDKWIFLELNPNGQWLWLEKSLNLDISRNIVEKLLSNG